MFFDMQRLFLSCLIVLSVAACNAIPVNPENNQPLVPDIEKYDHEQRLGIQQEVINMQERQKEKQEREYLELQKQEYYNNRAERFKNN